MKLRQLHSKIKQKSEKFRPTISIRKIESNAKNDKFQTLLKSSKFTIFHLKQYNGIMATTYSNLHPHMRWLEKTVFIFENSAFFMFFMSKKQTWYRGRFWWFPFMIFRVRR